MAQEYTLDEALAAFAATHQEYATAAGADDQCFIASVELQEVLSDYGLICEEGRERDWDVVEVERTPYFKLHGSIYSTHWVFRLGQKIIDVTARQFDPKLPFPVVLDMGQCDLKPGPPGVREEDLLDV